MKKIDQAINRFRPNLIRTVASSLESFESTDIPKTALKTIIEAKTSSAENEIRRLRYNSDVDAKKLQKLTDAVNTEGKKALKAVYNNDSAYFKNNLEALDLLEVIVKTDGSSPSFLVKNGTVDLSSAQPGLWNDILTTNKTSIDYAISCVGRIDKFGSHVGSGFLIAQNLFVTNRHVLQSIGSNNNSGSTVYDDVSVDFGFEYEGIKTLNRREFKKVIFDNGNLINPKLIDHSKIDMVIIELLPLNTACRVPQINFTKTIKELKSNSYMYTIGYPGDPGLAGLSVYGKLLEDIYQSTYGFKRLSPGQIINSDIKNSHTISHDASTLGGNSGSVIIGNNKLTSASAIHYGGTLKTPRENWGLLLESTLNIKDKTSGRLLSEILDSNGVITE
ncbi:trypsin-like serine peptidase [Flavobacterium panacagri]|uniref:trypsin-like serine peptidase n=1 Tax=Flavobacterium panacagri TaxID=3034146 RepID=UPI0025A66485|nr:trypsin-like peptidase domain-containing protein [Flavobacterium panacagri]